MKYHEEIIHDDKAREEVFFKAYIKIELLVEELEENIKDGYCIRDGKTVRSKDLAAEIENLKNKIDILNELFSGEECIKYKITETENKKSEIAELVQRKDEQEDDYEYHFENEEELEI